MNRQEIYQLLCREFVAAWGLDAPTMRPSDEVIAGQAALWADKAERDEDFAGMDEREWSWLFDDCRCRLAEKGRLKTPIPAWSDFVALRKSQATREAMHKHRESVPKSMRIESGEKQSENSGLLASMQDDLKNFLTAFELGRMIPAEVRALNFNQQAKRFVGEGGDRKIILDALDQSGISADAKAYLFAKASEDL